MLDDLPGEQQLLDLFIGRLAVRHTAQIICRDLLRIHILNEQAVHDIGHFVLGCRFQRSVQRHQADILFLGEDLKRFRLEARRDDDLQEDLGQLLCQRDAHRSVQCHDAAEDGDRIGFICLVPGSFDGIADPYAARIHVLDTDCGWLSFEILQDLDGRIAVLDIVIRKLFAMQLRSVGQ